MKFYKEQVREICKKLDELRYTPAGEIGPFLYQPSGYQLEAPEGEWQEFDTSLNFGGRDQHFWFRKDLHTPPAREHYQLYFFLRTADGEQSWDAIRPQALAYLNGECVQGLDINHQYLLLEGDRDYRLDLDFYCGMDDKTVRFLPALVWLDTRVEELYYDLKVALEAAKCLEKDSEEACRILLPLHQAVQLLDLRQPGSEAFYESVEKTRAFLKTELYEKTCGNATAIVDCVGHTHIDVAWLWTVAQTREKACRSFATVLRLMERYPEYKFMSSQPQLYQFVKEDAPELYKQIKQRVKEGRWEVEGGMWLEADCNLPSGESLVRQFLHGKRFMKQEFGVDSRTLWLPDVFGYSAALPQILRKSGVDRFFTSKISWSETNRMPYEAFWWQGIDGTEVFTSFATAQDKPKHGPSENIVTYVGNTEPRQVLGTWERYTDKNYTDEVLITFGYGDGGGGPTKHQLETQRRMSAGFPGYPRTRITTTGEYLDNIQRKFEEGCAKTGETPRWVGELYLEFHRGTYTSIAKNKRNNRQCEFLYQEAETLSCLDRLLLGNAYPAETLYKSWETILLNQFHDIIPGSSLYEVYEVCDREYAQLRKTGNEIVDSKLAHLSKAVGGRGLLVYNPSGFRRSGLVEQDGKQLWVEHIPAMGWNVVEKPETSCHVAVDAHSLENDFIRVELDENGFISSLFDKKANRQVVRPGGRLNTLEVFEDIPKEYDAWELTNYYKNKRWLMDQVDRVEIVDQGARKGLRITRKYLSSTFVQTMFLTDHSAQLDFVTEVDWHEHHQLVKAAFDVDVLATSATYEIQFGHLTRPTHGNTSWDAAKFEVCAHKWADIAEEGYGLAVMNDCKYGYSAEGSTLKLTLLKCATYPNPQADQGHHVFTYSLLPHEGSFREAGVIQSAYALNQPMKAVALSGETGSLPKTFGLAQVTAADWILETAKQAEDSEDVIFRLYEAYGRRSSGSIRFALPVREASLCDLMEGNEEPLSVTDNAVELTLKPFEIVTLKVRF